MRLVSWNINSLRLRRDDVSRLVDMVNPDVICLQETKCPDDAFPSAAVAAMGYPHQHIWGIKGYNGVAIISRRPLSDPRRHRRCGRDDARHISCRIKMDECQDGGKGRWLYLDNMYVPAGGDIPDPVANPKFAHKMDFLDDMIQWSQKAFGARAVVGDFNIAPLAADVWSHRQLVRVVCHTPGEVDALERVRRSGRWLDAVRHVTGDATKLFTWWSYRNIDYRRANRGRRLDHIWLRGTAIRWLKHAFIVTDTRGWPRPSDHVPVVCDL